MRAFVHIRCRDRASGLRPLRSAALAVGALLALGAPAVAQSSAGVSVDWNALTQSATPAAGLAVDWGALDALRPAPPGEAPGTIVLHPPPKPQVAVVAMPKPVAKPVVAAPKPVTPVVATVPPRAPVVPRADTAAP